MKLVQYDQFGKNMLCEMNDFGMHDRVAQAAQCAQMGRRWPRTICYPAGRVQLACCQDFSDDFGGQTPAARLMMRSVCSCGTPQKHRRQAPIPRRVDGWRAEEPGLQ